MRRTDDAIMEDIRNEVDHLIDLLRTEPVHPYRLSKLASEAHLSVPQARKWIHILEARGQVKVRYNLSDDEILWVGQPIPHALHGVGSSSKNVPASGDDVQLEVAHWNESQFRLQRGVPAGEDESTDEKKTDNAKEEKEPLARQLSQASPYPSENEVPFSMTAGKKKEKSGRTFPVPGAATPREPPAPTQTPIPIYDQTKEEEEEPEGPALPPLPAIDERTVKMSQKLKAQIEKARAKMSEIEKIKEEKRRLLVEVYRPMETKLEQEAGTITERLIKLENQILALREEAAKVPSEFAELASEQERIVYVAGEMRRAYNETNAQMTQSMQALRQARQNAQMRLDEARSSVAAQQASEEQIRKTLETLTMMEADSQKRVAEAQETLAAQQAQLDVATQHLGQLENIKSGLEERLSGAQGGVEQQKALLGDVEKQLGQLDRVQEWVQVHQQEYDQRMRALADYIENASREHAKLKSAVDTGFVHRYLKDLRALSESYEFEMSQAQRLEGNIDERLAATKAELAALLAQAREIADMQEMHLTHNDDEKSAVAATNREHLFEDVTSEKGERDKLRDLIRRTVSGEEVDEKTSQLGRRSGEGPAMLDLDESALKPETPAENVPLSGEKEHKKGKHKSGGKKGRQ